MLKGYKTVFFNALVIFLTMGLQGVAGFDWVSAVGPEWAVMIVGAVNLVLRFVTTSPVFKAE